MSNYNSLTGKWVLITGGAGGIGRALAEAFAAVGSNIIFCCRTQTTAVDEFLDAIKSRSGVKTALLCFDITDFSATQRAISSLQSMGIQADVLINNAGAAHGGLTLLTPMSQIKNIFEINFFSQVYISQLVGKLMLRRRSGCIINIASIAGLDQKSGNIAYGASKSALIYATGVLAQELGPHGIRVNAIAPGLTDTAMADKMEEKAKADMVAGSCMKRLATPAEIAGVSVFLASAEACFVNGQTIRVDGGMQ